MAVTKLNGCVIYGCKIREECGAQYSGENPPCACGDEVMHDVWHLMARIEEVYGTELWSREARTDLEKAAQTVHKSIFTKFVDIKKHRDNAKRESRNQARRFKTGLAIVQAEVGKKVKKRKRRR